MIEYSKFFSPFFWIKFIVSPRELIHEEKEKASEKTGLLVLVFFSVLFTFLTHAVKFAFFGNMDFLAFLVESLARIFGFFVGASTIYMAAKFFGGRGEVKKIFYLLVLTMAFFYLLSAPIHIAFIFLANSQGLLFFLFFSLSLVVMLYYTYLNYLVVREIFSLPTTKSIICVLWLQALFLIVAAGFVFAALFFYSAAPAFSPV